jgi:hypothetical protein
MTLTPQNKVLKVGSVTKSVWELLASHKYDIDYFQREYRWEEKHVTALLDDLERKFFDSFHEGDSRLQVQKYPHYFLGSIIVSHRDGSDSIIDGQQRLTTLTLLLVHLYHLQNEQHIPPDAGSPVVDLIFSAPYGDKTFNLDILQRKACMEALFAGQPYDASDEPDESIRNLAARYQDIVEHFPDDIKNGRLLHFTDWLKGNVDLVQITVYSDEEAYAIFEAMNDRGLRLNPTEMLKAHLLAKVDDPAKREAANRLWREWIDKLILIDKEDELDFFRAWLRAQYAQKMRDRQPGAVNQDFEEIATRYHEWVRKHESQLGLSKHDDVFSFIDHDFRHFAEYYYRVRKAATTFDADLDVIYFNGWTKFTLQYPLVLAPIRADDDWQMARRKIRLVATYLDIFVARRMVNFRTLRYSSIVYTMFNLMKEIRGLAVTDLVEKLKQNLAQAQETFDGVRSLYMHQQNHSQIHYLLARITSYIEAETA